MNDCATNLLHKESIVKRRSNHQITIFLLHITFKSIVHNRTFSAGTQLLAPKMCQNSLKLKNKGRSTLMADKVNKIFGNENLVVPI